MIRLEVVFLISSSDLLNTHHYFISCIQLQHDEVRSPLFLLSYTRVTLVNPYTPLDYFYQSLGLHAIGMFIVFHNWFYPIIQVIHLNLFLSRFIYIYPPTRFMTLWSYIRRHDCYLHVILTAELTCLPGGYYNTVYSIEDKFAGRTCRVICFW